MVTRVYDKMNATEAAYLNREAKRVVEEHLKVSPKTPVRVTTRLAKIILLQYPVVIFKYHDQWGIERADDYVTKTKSIGAGVHEIFLVSKVP